jgi:hypothetical protein
MPSIILQAPFGHSPENKTNPTTNSLRRSPDFSNNIPEFVYPFHVDVQYTNDMEYRECIRQVFQMEKHHSVEQEVPKEDIDEISRDELNYDAEMFTRFLDTIFLHTRSNDDFIELYKLSASVFFSREEIIGLTVLFSYDYFHHFHKCLCAFFDNPWMDMTTNSQFQFLISVFRK